VGLHTTARHYERATGSKRLHSQQAWRSQAIKHEKNYQVSDLPEPLEMLNPMLPVKLELYTHKGVLTDERLGLQTRLRSHEKRFVARANEELTAFMELESTICAGSGLV
jgi:hypothetical protein